MKKKRLKDSYDELLKKYNTLDLKYKALEEQIKSDIFYQVINLLNQRDALEICIKENKNMRDELKSFKKIKFENEINKIKKQNKKEEGK